MEIYSFTLPFVKEKEAHEDKVSRAHLRHTRDLTTGISNLINSAAMLFPALFAANNGSYV